MGRTKKPLDVPANKPSVLNGRVCPLHGVKGRPKGCGYYQKHLTHKDGVPVFCADCRKYRKVGNGKESL